MHPIVAWGTVISHPLGHCAKAGTLQPEIKKHPADTHYLYPCWRQQTHGLTEVQVYPDVCS